MGKVRGQWQTNKPIYGDIAKVNDLSLNIQENGVSDAPLDGSFKDYADFLSERYMLIAGTIQDYYRSP
jgi:hypothetical protein